MTSRCLVSCRIGHTPLTHSYILKKDPPPVCEHCQCNLTVRHILVECNHFAQERKDIFGRRDVVESFRFHPTLIVLFLKQTEFYYINFNNPNRYFIAQLFTLFHNILIFLMI